MLLVSETVVKELSLTPSLRWVAAATAGVDPNYMGEGPIPAVKKALARTGLRAPNVDLVELNEAFAVQALACIRGLDLDPARVNVKGGAVALGHPIGASGRTYRDDTLSHDARNRESRVGLAALMHRSRPRDAALFERA